MSKADANLFEYKKSVANEDVTTLFAECDPERAAEAHLPSCTQSLVLIKRLDVARTVNKASRKFFTLLS